MATMTQEEREEYLKKMRERYGPSFQTQYTRKPGEGPEVIQMQPIRAAVEGPQFAYGTAERPTSGVRVTALTDEEKERERERLQREKFEREKQLREQERLEWERREREKHK